MRSVIHSFLHHRQPGRWVLRSLLLSRETESPGWMAFKEHLPMGVVLEWRRVLVT